MDPPKGLKDRGITSIKWMAMMLRALAFAGYMVTDVYFFDHCGMDFDTGVVEGLWFGHEYYSLKKLEELLPWLGSATSESCTLHFRHCFVAEDIDFLKDLAKSSSRSVIGSEGPITYDWPVHVGEKDGYPDYTISGKTWMVKPDGSSEIYYDPSHSWEWEAAHPGCGLPY
jgi:hypothetical protein